MKMIMSAILHETTFNFLKCVHIRYVKYLFTGIWKQKNMLEITLLVKKFSNFMSKQIKNSYNLVKRLTVRITTLPASSLLKINEPDP